MKNIKKIFISLFIFGLALNNIAYASEGTTQTNAFPIKYIFIGVAALVVVLLLFLGYRMDTKGSDTYSQKSSKAEKMYPTQEDTPYEEDKGITYESDDNVKSSDVYDSIEYSDDEDEDESLFATVNKEDEDSLFDDEDDDSYKTDENSEDNYEDFDEDNDIEDSGEEFDTSIIDSIDEENEEESTPKSSFDETMVFNNNVTDDSNEINDEYDDDLDSDEYDKTDLDTDKENDDVNLDNNEEDDDTNLDLDNYEENDTTDNYEELDTGEYEDNLSDEEELKVEKEIDSLDDDNSMDLLNNDSDDSFINELKNFKEPEESDFTGFSVREPDINDEKTETANGENDISDQIDNTVKKATKKYTKVKKSVKHVQETFDDLDITNDFLAQMKENLPEPEEEKKVKKSGIKVATRKKTAETAVTAKKKRQTKKSE